MKRLFPIIALVCLFVLWGCPNEGPTPAPPTPEDPVLEPATSMTDYTIGPEGGEISLKVKTNLASLQVKSSDPSWLTVSVSTKAVTTQVITVKATANTTVETRSAKVTVNAETQSIEFNVTQEGVTPTIEIPITSYSVPADGGTVTVGVTSNVTYTVNVNADWIKKDGEVFKVEANDSEETRSGTITYSYGEISKNVTITQAGKEKPEEHYINVSGTAFSVEAAGGQVTVEVNSNVEYDTSIGAGWVTGKVPTFTVAANTDTKERSTTITFSYGDIVKTVTIAQAGKPEDPYINIDYPAVSVPASGETFELNVTSNVTYETVISEPSWVSMNGKTVTVAENKSYNDRSATITFSYGEKVKTTFTINQAAAVEPYILNYIGDEKYDVPAEGYTINVKVQTNVDYTTTISAPEWVTEGTKAVREDEKTFIVARNDGEARTATITFSYNDIIRVITINQAEHTEDPYITIVTSTAAPVPAEGGQFSVEVASNVEYETELGAEWITGSVPTFTVAQNESYEERSTTITFKYGEIVKTVTVTQQAAIEPDVLEFLGGEPTFTVAAEGGVVSFTVKANGEYTVTSSASWITQSVGSKAKEVREDELSFDVAANDGAARNASITVSLNDLSIVVTVAQAAYVPPVPDEPYLTVDPLVIEAETAGGEYVVNISTNLEPEDYTITPKTIEWIAMTEIEGGLKLVVSENAGTEPRSVIITFRSSELDSDVKLTVTQEGTVSDEDPFDVSGHGNNLSWNGTANCYVVIKEGNYTFDASVMGNGKEGFLWEEPRSTDGAMWPWNADQTKFKHSSNQYSGYIKPFHALEIWDDNDVITDVQLDYSKMIISFKATGAKGNALIGLFNKDEGLTEGVVWSWHIWCTDSPQQFRQYGLLRSGDDYEFVILDRNIGATSANPADGAATYGYFYQFGRPNPLKAYIGIAQDMKACASTMREALSHPTFVYHGYNTKTNSWFDGQLFSTFADLWGDPRHLNAVVGEGAQDILHPDPSLPSELKKTIYDPCPPGYMVAPETVWTQTGMQDDDVYPISFTEDGAFIRTEDGDSFYPFAGYISALQSRESAASNLGWDGFKGYKDVLIPEDNNPDPDGGGGSGTHNCHDFRTMAAVYTSCTGSTGWYVSESGWNLYGAKLIGFTPDGDVRDLNGSPIGTVRQRALPVRCVKIPN